MTNQHTFKLTISKVNEQLFSGDAFSVTVPGTEGVMTILANHEPLITMLKKGVVTVKSNGDVKTIIIEKGLLETSNGQVTVLL